MEKLLIVAKAAYVGYKNCWIEENPYSYAAGIEKPISFTEFLETIWLERNKVNTYLFITPNFYPADEAAEALENAKKMIAYYDDFMTTHDNTVVELKKEIAKHAKNS